MTAHRIWYEVRQEETRWLHQKSIARPNGPMFFTMGGRAGSSGRELVFERRIGFLERKRGWLFGLILGYLAMSVILAMLTVRYFRPGAEALFGALVVGFFWVITWFLNVDDSYFVRTGAEAEEWTSQALRKHLPDWFLLDDVALEWSNVDHVLVGPGGLFAVETKWRSRWRDRQVDPSQWVLRADLRDAQERAQELQDCLMRYGLVVEVKPALIIWGPGIKPVETFVQFGRVHFLMGARRKEWPSVAFSRGSLSTSEIAAITSTLERVDEENQFRTSRLERTRRVLRVLLGHKTLQQSLLPSREKASR
jgi:hypothetical protein